MCTITSLWKPQMQYAKECVIQNNICNEKVYSNLQIWRILHMWKLLKLRFHGCRCGSATQGTFQRVNSA